MDCSLKSILDLILRSAIATKHFTSTKQRI